MDIPALRDGGWKWRGCAACWQCRGNTVPRPLLGDVQQKGLNCICRLFFLETCSRHVPSSPCSIYSPKQAEKFPRLGKWWAVLWCFLSAVLEGRKKGQESSQDTGEKTLSDTQESTATWDRYVASPSWIRVKWCRRNTRAHNCESENKLGFFLIFKSGLCHTVVTVTVPFVLWSKSIDLLLGQDKGLDSPENKLLVFPLLFKLPLSWKLLAIEDDFFLCLCHQAMLVSVSETGKIPIRLYIVQQHICWVQFVFMVIFWYITAMLLPSPLTTAPLLDK